MIHAQLGNPREAREYYDRAAAVIDKFAPRNLGWNHKQDQAAAMLGIER